jgi:phosphoglycerol transferase MdoB-like AlkP superfamily enzyme
MDTSFLFQMFLRQFSPIASFLAISSFLYVALGKSKMFHFHPISRLILSTIIGLYSANSFDFSRIISVAATATLIGIIAVLVWNVALQRGKTLQQSLSVAASDPLNLSKYQEILLRKLLGEGSK